MGREKAEVALLTRGPNGGSSPPPRWRPLVGPKRRPVRAAQPTSPIAFDSPRSGLHARVPRVSNGGAVTEKIAIRVGSKDSKIPARGRNQVLAYSPSRSRLALPSEDRIPALQAAEDALPQMPPETCVIRVGLSRPALVPDSDGTHPS